MTSDPIELYDGTLKQTSTLRDIAWVLFRHWRIMLATFAVIVLGFVAYALFVPETYTAETEILVKRERVDPVVTTDSNQMPLVTPAVSEEDLNSEVELLRSEDLLKRVVIACGLDKQPPSLLGRLILRLSLGPDKARLAVPLAIRALRKKLEVEAIRKTNLVRATYQSPDPTLAANVLNTLTALYLQKHLEVHRPPGTLAFFQRQTDQYWKGLQVAEENLANFNRSQDTVSATMEKSADQQKLADFEASLREINITTAATEGRIHTLRAQLAKTPTRLMTKISTNSLLMQQLRSTLLDLQLKRTSMNGKYAADYVPLRDLEAEIAETKAAIAKEEALPLHDDTTDQNPTYLWLSDELAKATTDLASLQRQKAATEGQVRGYRSELLVLDSKDLRQKNLLRTEKIQEANYILYQQKREEARISDALDQKHIVNVTVAAAAMEPALPSSLTPLMLLAFGCVLASGASVGVAYGAEHFSTSLPRPDAVRLLLEAPVLASFQEESRAVTERVPHLDT
jgi:uncharacterized protein involved in exopolysaccharide biosynthesis